ncbi:MAG: DMT family transporter [Mangrovicoccus sp.]|nr:DMT family transporter [Mangrovicoccus sp.]
MPLSALSPNARGAMLALAAFAVYSTHDVFVKLMGERYSPVQIVFFTVLFSFPVFTLMMIRRSSSGSLWPRHPWWSLARAAMVLITGFAAFTAFTLLPLAQTYALLFAMPMLITILSVPMLGEKVGAARAIAVVVGLIGVLVVLRPGTTALSLGHLAGVIAAMAGAAASVIVRKIGGRESAAVLLLYPLLANLMVMGVVLPFVYVPMPLEHLATFAAIAVMSLAGMALTIAAYRVGEATVVAPMQYSQIVWATVYGALIFSELPDTPTLVGAGIVILSGVFIVWRENASSPPSGQPVLKTRTRLDTGTAPRVGQMIDAGGADQRP